MPELPDVETYRRYLQSRVLRRTIVRVAIPAPEMVRGVSAKKLQSRLQGSRFSSTQRHGKYLFLEITQGGWLLLHFGMTGYPVVGKQDARGKHSRLGIDFANGQSLAFHDPRKFGQIGLIKDVQSFIESRRLGPDALQVSRAAFDALFKRRKGGIKAAFMDQHVIAGLGNVYVDEILFQADVNPMASLTSLTAATRGRLFQIMRRVLRRAIAVGAEPQRLPRTYQLPHRRKAGNCPRCGSEWSTMIIGGRTTYYCRRHQKR